VKIFSLAFWASALEHAIVAGAAVLAGSQVFTGGQLTAKTWEAAGISAGIAALYAFVKFVGGTQLYNGVLKVGTARHAATLRARKGDQPVTPTNQGGPQ
jgi:hypothetical protein